MTHVVDGGRASWSALVALASLQRSDDQTDVAMTVIALGGEAGRHRAKLAGITLEDTDVSLRKRLRHADLAVVWDSSTRASITKLAPNLRILQPPTPIPARSQLFAQHTQHEIRSQLDLPPQLPIMAFLSDPFDSHGMFTFASLLIAVGLAGFPAVGVAMDGAIDEKTLETLSRIGRGSQLVVRTVTPWALLPVCDCAIALEAINDASPFVADLTQWASAAGTPIMAPASRQTDHDASSPLRFILARKLLRSLKSRPDAHGPAPIAMHSNDAKYDHWFEDFQTLLRNAADHCGVL